MKVLFVVHGYPDGLGNQAHIFTHNQAVALKKAGVDIAVMFIDLRSLRRRRPLGMTSYYVDNIKVFRCAIPCGPLRLLLAVGEYCARNLLYKQIAYEFGKPDIMHAHFFKAGYSAMKISEKYGIPYIVTEHGSRVLQRKLSKSDLRRSALVYNNASEVISVSKALKNVVDKITSSNVSVINNVIPDYYFSSQLATYTKPGEFTFISVGSLISRKRMDLTITAFADLARRHSNVKLYIIGTGPLKRSLVRLSKKLGIKDNIDFLGMVPNGDLPLLFSKCNCFVLPSDCETFGVVYAEALSRGLPVIATRCGGPEEYISEECGILINVDDINCLSTAMECMYHTANTYDEKKFSQMIYDKFSGKRISKEILAVYADVLQEYY